MSSTSTESLTEQLLSLSNWGRWGEHDELGTLNFIGPNQRRRAASLVQTGTAVSCAFEVEGRSRAGDRVSPQHYMLTSGEGFAERDAVPQPAHVALDVLVMPVHGVHDTHLDALGHYFLDGKMYNGLPAADVSAQFGATRNAVTAASDGFFTRGVLFDVPRLRGVEFVPGGTGVTADDILEFENKLEIRLEEGDVAILRTGREARQASQSSTGAETSFAGWHASAVPLLAERGIAAIANDGPNDTVPTDVPGIPRPVHQIGIARLGLWIFDNLDLAELASVCAELGRSTFCFTAAPLRFRGATGSPINPIAVF